MFMGMDDSVENGLEGEGGLEGGGSLFWNVRLMFPINGERVA